MNTKKAKKKYIKKYNFRKQYSYFPQMLAKKTKQKYHMKDFILLKKMQKNFFSDAFTSRQMSMDLNQTFSSSRTAH